MNLENFEQHIDAKIVDRGYNYFFDGRVDRPEQTESGIWRARVYGTVPYNVTIHIDAKNNLEISGWKCSCPFDYGPVCKHVVAALYVMAQQGEEELGSSRKGPMQKTRKEKMQAIFDDANKKDLEKFIRSSFNSMDGLKDRFLAHFAERLEDDPARQYRTIIRNYGRKAMGHHGFIDYRSAPTLTDPLYDLNNKADKLLQAGKTKEALVLCQILIEEVPVFLERMDDSDGGAGDVVLFAFDTLHEMIDYASSEIKDTLFRWGMEEFPKQKYHDFGFEDHFLKLLPSVVENQEQEKRFFDLLDRQINRGNSKSHQVYRVRRMVNAKLTYLQNKNRDEKALQLLRNHQEIPDFREQLVDRAVDAGDFDTAKARCEQGIKEAKEQNHPGTVGRWQEKLYHIAETEHNVPDMRRRAEALFFDRRSTMQWYRALKATYDEQEWSEKCEQIIRRLKKTTTSVYHSNTRILANIFVEENDIERLLEHVQQNADIFFVDRYAKHLSEVYPYEMLDLYEQSISKYAKQTGRKRYREIAGWLQKMTKVLGGNERAHALFKRFFRKYHNRPAMKDELGKAFPEWATSSNR